MSSIAPSVGRRRSAPVPRVYGERYAPPLLTHVARPSNTCTVTECRPSASPVEGTVTAIDSEDHGSGVQAILVSAYAGRHVTGRPVDVTVVGVGRTR